MEVKSLTNTNSFATMSARKLICVNLVAIAFMDSFVLWNDPLPGKLFTYALKLINIFAIVFLAEKTTLNKYIWAIITIPLLWIVWDETSLPASLQYFYSSTLPVICFLLLRDEEQSFVARTYLKFILFLFIPGLLIYILINLLPVPHLAYTRSLDQRSYENYFFLYYSLAHTRFRFFSVFDEPGVVGSLAAIVVFYYRKVLSRRAYIIYVIAGILSVSLFFLLSFIPAYYFSEIRYLSLRKRVTKSLMALVAAAAFYLLIVFLLNQIRDDSLLSYALYNRFKWENGFIVGVVNNRDAAIIGFEDAYDSFIEKNGLTFWLGNGKNSVAQRFGNSGLSYRILLFEKGMLTGIYLMLLILLLHPWRKQFIFSLLSVGFLLLLLYQRPLFFKIDYFILIFTGVKLISKYAEKKNYTYNP